MSVGGVLNADGSVVAFSHLGGLYGTNSDNQAEVVVYDVEADTYDRVTDTPSAGGAFPIGSASPRLDAAGDDLVFTSDGNPNTLNSDSTTRAVPPRSRRRHDREAHLG